MLIEINNLVKAPIDNTRIKKIIQRVLNNLKQIQKLKPSFAKAMEGEEISIVLVGNKKIKKLNKDYRQIDRVTDVLSFEEVNEIIICYPQAKRQAQKNKHSVKKEIEILLIHGLLHLLGYDHQKEHDAVKMKKLEKRLIKNYMGGRQD